MPDILIRGMEMPESCRECFACFPGRDDNDEPTTYCALTEPTSPADCWGVIDGIDHQRQRMNFCPLHELPEHGDLISRDELLESLRESVGACHKWIDEMRAMDDERMVEIAQQSHSTFIEAILRVKAMPVIAPASEEATNDPKP